MQKIDVSFSKDEFKLLFKLIYTGYFVCDKTPERDEKNMQNLVDRFLQIAHSYNILEGIEFDEKLAGYFMNSDCEDEILEDYNDFIEDRFWDELSYRLSIRDLIKKLGEEKYKSLDSMKRIEEVTKIEDEYENEFEENGLERLKIEK